MDRAPLGYYFHTTWREDGKLFATRHDYTPNEATQAKKAHDGAMTYMWAQGKRDAQVSGMYDQWQRMARHGSRQGEPRPATYDAVPMPDDVRARMASW
jgi:hypothetical protein